MLKKYLFKKKISKQSGTRYMRVCKSFNVRPREGRQLSCQSALSAVLSPYSAQRKSSLTRPCSREGEESLNSFLAQLWAWFLISHPNLESGGFLKVTRSVGSGTVSLSVM